MYRFIAALFLLRLRCKQMPPSVDRRLTEPAALAPTERHPLTRRPERSIPLILTNRPSRVRNGVLSLMATGFAISEPEAP
jgi:hypothetical protein